MELRVSRWSEVENLRPEVLPHTKGEHWGRVDCRVVRAVELDPLRLGLVASRDDEQRVVRVVVVAHRVEHRRDVGRVLHGALQRSGHARRPRTVPLIVGESDGAVAAADLAGAVEVRHVEGNPWLPAVEPPRHVAALVHRRVVLAHDERVGRQRHAGVEGRLRAAQVDDHGLVLESAVVVRAPNVCVFPWGRGKVRRDEQLHEARDARGLEFLHQLRVVVNERRGHHEHAVAVDHEVVARVHEAGVARHGHVAALAELVRLPLPEQVGVVVLRRVADEQLAAVDAHGRVAVRRARGAHVGLRLRVTNGCQLLEHRNQ
mmetsp:Transcript_22693/g.70326  ORF Transcript_22693/g.70326 Transcript_22693/m.70326 type:complete len:317 (+) Transcript_22693:298-1248(+)